VLLGGWRDALPVLAVPAFHVEVVEHAAQHRTVAPWLNSYGASCRRRLVWWYVPFSSPSRLTSIASQRGLESISREGCEHPSLTVRQGVVVYGGDRDLE
jgi:hypothetical protein